MTALGPDFDVRRQGAFQELMSSDARINAQMIMIQSAILISSATAKVPSKSFPRMLTMQHAKERIVPGSARVILLQCIICRE